MKYRNKIFYLILPSKKKRFNVRVIDRIHETTRRDKNDKVMKTYLNILVRSSQLL